MKNPTRFFEKVEAGIEDQFRRVREPFLSELSQAYSASTKSRRQVDGVVFGNSDRGVPNYRVRQQRGSATLEGERSESVDGFTRL